MKQREFRNQNTHPTTALSRVLKLEDSKYVDLECVMG